MSDIKDLYITLQKYFWALESDLANQMNSANNQFIFCKLDADILLKPVNLSGQISLLNRIQRDINKIMEVYLHE